MFKNKSEYKEVLLQLAKETMVVAYCPKNSASFLSKLSECRMLPVKIKLVTETRVGDVRPAVLLWRILFSLALTNVHDLTECSSETHSGEIMLRSPLCFSFLASVAGKLIMWWKGASILRELTWWKKESSKSWFYFYTLTQAFNVPLSHPANAIYYERWNYMFQFRVLGFIKQIISCFLSPFFS